MINDCNQSYNAQKCLDVSLSVRCRRMFQGSVSIQQHPALKRHRIQGTPSGISYSQNFEKRLLAKSCLTVRLSVRME